MEGTREVRKAALFHLDKMKDKVRDLEVRINETLEKQGAKDYKKSTNHISDFTLYTWMIEFELLKDGIDHLEDQIIENVFDI